MKLFKEVWKAMLVGCVVGLIPGAIMFLSEGADEWYPTFWSTCVVCATIIGVGEVLLDSRNKT